MIKSRYIALLLLFSLCIFGLFQIKFKVQHLHLELTELKTQLVREKNLIHVLKAEWAYLNTPERLQRLAKKFLNLAEMTPEQILLSATSGKTIATAQKTATGSPIVRVSYVPNKKIAKWNYKERPDLKRRK